MSEQLSITVPCIKEIDHVFSNSVHEVVIEAPYALWVNGRQILNVMTSPSRLEDFVVGYLYTERLIKQVDDIESLQIEKQTIRVLTTGKVPIREGKKTILSGCGGDSTFLDIKKLPKVSSDIVMDPTWLHQALKIVLDSDLHIRTGGIHVVGLVNSDKMITKTEDIGRHNALDRVIGYAIRTGVDLTRTCVLISGRISSEMARKCVLAGIPMIASRGATTSLAIEMAQATGLTVIGFIRGGKMNIYTSPWRVAYAQVPNPE